MDNLSKYISKLKTTVRVSKNTFDLISEIFSIVKDIGRAKSPLDIAILKFYSRKSSPFLINLHNKMKSKPVLLLTKSGFAEFLLLPMFLPPAKIKDVGSSLAIYSDLYIKMNNKIPQLISVLDISKATILKSNLKSFCKTLSNTDITSEEDKDVVRKETIEKDEVLKSDVKKKLLAAVKKSEEKRAEKKKKEKASTIPISKTSKEIINKSRFSKRDLEYVDSFRSTREKKAKAGADGLLELVKMFNKLGIKNRKEFYINSKKLDKMGAMRAIGYNEAPTNINGKPMGIKDCLKCSFSEDPRKKDLILFKYQDGYFYSLISGGDKQKNFWSDTMRVARGIIIDRKKLKIVNRPQNKFYNISSDSDEHIEHPESIISNLPDSEPFEALEKLDGVQIMVSAYNGILLVNTNGSLDSKYNDIAERIINSKYGSIKNKLIKFLDETKSTLCFELIDKEAEIVVDYSKAGSRNWVYPDGSVGDKHFTDGEFPSELVLHSWVQG